MPENAMTLADFLLAMFAEDEAVARAADSEPHWEAEGDLVFAVAVPLDSSLRCDQHTVVPNDCDDRRILEVDDFGKEEAAVHVARHDPARVLAECEAKRRIVKELWDWQAQLEAQGAGSDMRDWGVRDGLEMACELLALPYADHEHFREEWKP